MSRILDIFERSLKRSKADQTELVFEREEFYLTRFAESRIGQNMGRADHTIWCRAIIDNKIGIARTNELSNEAIDKLIDTACEICSQQLPDPQFKTLVSSPNTTSSKGFVEATAEYAAENRAKAVKKIVDLASLDRLAVSGMFQTSQTEMVVANSLGTRQQDKVTQARLSITLSDDTARAGFAQAFSRDTASIDFAEIAQRAIGKAARPSEPVSLGPGTYTVILEPEAVADFLLFLAFLGFGGKGIANHRSFMADKIGSQIMGQNITIIEDPQHPMMNYMSFDYEGVPRQKVIIVENGIARNAVFDSYYAGLAGTDSTGSALEPDNSYGPYPKAMVMTGGEKSLADIIAETERAIYITHFWYLNFVNPMRTTVTGTTRDGTFLIENGSLKAPIIDMRINQSMLEAFNNAELLSAERRVVPKYGVLMYVPAMKINNFNFVANE